MFPTFISILDIQSWWEVPSIAHFCSLFRTAFNLLDFDIEDLEEALLADGTEESSWLQELIVRLLSGCLPNNEISTFNYQMFLRRLFRQKCQEHDRYNPFNTDIDFQLLPLRTKVDILHALCDFRLDADDVLDQLKNLEADSLRVEPLGYDGNDSAYWYFYGTRLYREDYKTKNNKKKCVWQVICFTEDDWFQLDKKFKKSESKAERQLHRTLSENFLPELPRLFKEKERLARKRLLENQPRRASRRLRRVENISLIETKSDLTTSEDDEDPIIKKTKGDSYEQKSKSDDTSDNNSGDNEGRYEMAGSKLRQKKNRTRQRDSSGNSMSANAKHTKKSSKKSASSSDTNSSSSVTMTVGRQTNNSLAAATGQIVIQPVSNPHKKKLKTSQVFRQTDEDLITGMHKILDFVKNHEDAWPFADPVDEDYAPNYYSIIRKPMDLQRMEDRLDSGYYKNFSRFREDFQLIVDNCRLYNGVENEYTEMVDNLSKVFEQATKKFLDQVSSSDDEIAVEFPDMDIDNKLNNKKRKCDNSPKKLQIKNEKKRERSLSAESTTEKIENDKSNKKQVLNAKTKKSTEMKEKKNHKIGKKMKKEKAANPLGGYCSSPPSSSRSPTPKMHADDKVETNKKNKYKHRNDKAKDDLPKSKNDKSSKEDKEKSSPSKPKDKHNNLRETIEKLKAKSKLSDIDLDFEMDVLKENEEKSKKDEKNKGRNKEKSKTTKKIDDTNEDNTHAAKKSKNAEIEALSIVTEQTLKDINKWFDDMPKFSESSSNSPSYTNLDDMDTTTSTPTKNDDRTTKKVVPKKETKDLKKRPNKFVRKREIQRTIDRLQPGKSKGNLLSNLQNTNKTNDDLFSLGPLAKIKDAKNSLIVKTDDNAPKLSLGTVLDSFGKHRFVDDQKKNEQPEEKKTDEVQKSADTTTEVKNEVNETKSTETISNDAKEETPLAGGATPNLSAWFKAFGAPKVTATPKKVEPKSDQNENKSSPKKDDVPTKAADTPVTNPESPMTPSSNHSMVRQRRISTGSSMSERSSFSQDMDSPRVGMDERMAGAYPAPYPSPMHRSPSGASPVMSASSPRPDCSPKSSAAYPAFNGQMRVGFYQDTASTKSSPEKSNACSPRDNPRSPYGQCQEHVYTPNTSTQPNMNYNYANTPYYGQATNYSTTNPTPPYNENPPTAAPPQPPPPYYDTNKSLTDQYQAKTGQNYDASMENVAPTPQNINEYRADEQRDKLNQNTVFPVKKRAYNDVEPINRYDMEMMNRNLQSNVDEGSQHPNEQMPGNEASKTYGSESKAMSDAYDKNSQQESVRNIVYTSNTSYNAYGNDYPLNIPNARDMSKYTNMGYAEQDVNFSRNLQQPYRNEMDFARNPQQNPCPPNEQTNDLRYTDPNLQMGYKNVDLNSNPNVQQAHGYNTLDMDQHLQGLRGNLANLSHIVDRFGNDERGMLGTPQYYGDKSVNPAHMFNKSMVPSGGGAAGPLPPMFTQSNVPVSVYNQNVQQQVSNYNRQMNELQPVESTKPNGPPEKKTRKKRSAKSTAASSGIVDIQTSTNHTSATAGATINNPTNQGFQSYAGLKNPTANSVMEPNAISLKTASVVPGSAFNFGPTPTGLGIGPTLYGDAKDPYPNFLEDFRSAPNYYMAAAAAAAHHRTPDASAADKQNRVAHQPPATAPPAQTTGYPFIGGQVRPPPGYPPFMPPPPQAQLMDYQHYVLNQGLLPPPPPGAYPPGYATLSMRQPYDSMTRPPWL